MQDRYSLKSYLVSLFSRYSLYISSLIILALFAALFDIATSYKIKEIIDSITLTPHAEVAGLLGLFVLYKLLHHGMFFIRRLLDIYYKPRLLVEVTSDIYTRTIAHSLHWFDSHLSGEIAGKIIDFENSLPQLITQCFRVLKTIATVVISLMFLLQVHKLSALVIAVFILIYTPVVYLLLKKQMQYQERYTSARQETVGIINDSITNIFGIKIIGNLRSEFALKLMPSLKRWSECDRKARQFDAYFVDNADTIMITLMSAAQIILLAYLYKSGQITAGGFAFIAMMTLKIHDDLDAIMEMLLFEINPAIAIVKSSFAFVSTQVDTPDQPDAALLTNVKGDISFDNVTFAYNDSKHDVLHNFSLSIPAGQRLGIVGTSGAGKTTIIKCLLRYFDVKNGQILVDGTNISATQQDSLRAHISIIPQDITLFHRTILENLQMARSDATTQDIINACKQARIHDGIMAMPLGYDSVVGERGVKVSGGQRQRIAIARAILKNAPILILDEATSALDTPTEKLIQASLNEMLETSNATVIAIAHRLSTLKHMDRIIVLDKGRIMEEGSHDELIKQENGLYKRLWEMQAI